MNPLKKPGWISFIMWPTREITTVLYIINPLGRVTCYSMEILLCSKTVSYLMNSESKGTNMFHGPSVVRLIPAKLIYTNSVASWFLPHQLCDIYHVWDKGHLQAEEIRCRLMEDFLHNFIFSSLWKLSKCTSLPPHQKQLFVILCLPKTKVQM